MGSRRTRSPRSACQVAGGAVLRRMGCTAWSPTPRATSSDDRPGCWPVSGHVLYRPRRARSFRAAGLLASRSDHAWQCVHCAEFLGDGKIVFEELPVPSPAPDSCSSGSGPTQFRHGPGPYSRGRP